MVFVAAALPMRTTWGPQLTMTVTPPWPTRRGRTPRLHDRSRRLRCRLGLRAAAWRAKLNIIAVIGDAASEAAARACVADLIDLSRRPSDTSPLIMIGELDAVVARVPQADLDILGLGASDELDEVRRMVQATRSSCLFTVDSGRESALV